MSTAYEAGRAIREGEGAGMNNGLSIAVFVVLVIISGLVALGAAPSRRHWGRSSLSPGFSFRP